MTERTFRTPSPHPPGSSGSGHRQTQSLSHGTPPVPALPKNMDLGSRQPGGDVQQEPQHRKANRLGMGSTPVRLASQKLESGEAPSWFGAAKVGDLGSVRRTDPAMASPPSSPLQVLSWEEELAEGARPNSQASSINFSYPTWMRLGSPIATQAAEHSTSSQTPPRASKSQPSAENRQTIRPSRVIQQSGGQAAVRHTRPRSASSPSDQALVYDPNSRRMVRQADLLALQQAAFDVSQQPTVSKKKKTPQRAGSHLAAGTMSRTKSDGSRTAPAAKIPATATAQVQPHPPAVIPPVREAQTDVGEPALKAIVSSPTIDAKRLEQDRSREAIELAQIGAPVVPTPTPATPDAARQAVRRQPSVVREEPEPENLELNEKPQRSISDALNAVPGWHRMQSPPRMATPPSYNGTVLAGQGPQAATSSFNISKDATRKPGAMGHGRTAQVSHERTHSSSPARQTHFGPVQENLTIRHSPPPRSISPRKSAMKHTSPPRGASPACDTSEASGSVTQEPPVSRKKSVRVSFDDVNTMAIGDSVLVDQDGSPLPTSPQHANRHSWFSNLGRTKDLPPLDDEEVMKPRPALPSFGSVRDRKPRETSPDQDERPLVRPKGDLRSSPPLLPSPPLGPSNDHVIGAILLMDQADGNKHPANTSRLREPLPPVVTSVEGTGYISDSSDFSSFVSSEFEQPETFLSSTISEPQPEAASGSEVVLPKAPVYGPAANTDTELSPTQADNEQDTSPESQIPMISVSQPTPLGAENKALGQYFPDLPGMFPEDESDPAVSGANGSTQVVALARPVEAIPKGQSAQPDLPATQPTVAEPSSDSESSIYSDAYEDLSDIEGDGFQSLDAVVESPLEGSPRSVTQPRDIPREAPKLRMEISSATTAVETPPPESPHDEWEKAKAYWRSLTAERRAQLEREAQEEAGVEADMEGVQPETKQKKKKTVERRNSERRALADHMAQQTTAQQEQKIVDPERSYMIKPGARWPADDLAVPSMRNSMRIEPQQAATTPAQGARLRKSMRASRSSFVEPEPPAVQTRAETKRPMSSPAAIAAPRRTEGHRRSATQISSQLEASPEEVRDFQPTLRRRDSTDSESSFKRSRSGTQAQGFGFRQSLRPTSPPSDQDARSSKRFSLRTLSSAGSSPKQNVQARPVSSSAMRTTLRDSSTGKKSASGIHMPSFSLSYGGKKSGGRAKLPKAKSSGSRFSSRIADSSDEDAGGISSGFRSRFEDSSDDEPVMPVPLPLPLPNSYHGPNTAHSLRKPSSLASTALPEELEEESDEPQHAAPQGTMVPPTNANPPSLDATAATAAIRRTRSGSGRGQLLPASQIVPSSPGTAAAAAAAPARGSSKRSGFMSVLRHRNKKKDVTGAAAAGKIARAEVSESAARRDTRLERSVGQLKGIRTSDDVDGADETELEVMETVPRSPRLQKRIVASKTLPEMMSVAAPAAVSSGSGGRRFQEEAEKDEDVFGEPQPLRRNGSSGNLGTRTLSGGFLQRKVWSVGADMPAPSVDGSVAGSMAASSTTRKKRFGALRRMFGLHG